MKFLTLSIFVLISLNISGQNIEVFNKTKIYDFKKKVDALCKLIPGTDSCFITGNNLDGLSILNLQTFNLEYITNTIGAGANPVYNSFTNQIFYTEQIFVDKKKYSRILYYSGKSKSRNIFCDTLRNFGNMYFENNALIYTNSSKVFRKNFVKSDVEIQNIDSSKIFTSNNNLNLNLYKGDNCTVLNPNGNGYYIWTSLSPQRDKILYYFCGQGTFICDLNGIILNKIENLHDAKWLSDNLIIGMNDIDNGNTVVSSDIIVYSIKSNNYQNLTNSDNKIEMYPSVDNINRKICYKTLNDGIYLLEFKIVE